MMHIIWLSHFQVQGNLRQIECPSKNFYVTLQEAIRTLIQPFHNILRLFDVLPNIPFATSKTKLDYY